MREEARFDETERGRVPADDGWWVANLAEIGWERVEGGGTWCSFESPSAPSSTLGAGVHVLWPGDAPGFYHEESDQEDFIVLSGECIAIVEGQEPGDVLHSPPGTRHIIVGAGDGPCAIVMVGTRSKDGSILYVAEEAAARHGAAVPEDTSSPKKAYADRPPIEPARSPWPL